MIKLHSRHGLFKEGRRVVRPYKVILHHTAGGSLSGAESTLQQRGLGYHYMIDYEGDVYEYVPADRWTAHAYKNNRGTVGVSFIGGGKYGAANEQQIEACIDLCNYLRQRYPSIKEISGHKHVDTRGWKIDPRFAGEPADGVDLDVDKENMDYIADGCGLTFTTR